MARGVGIWAGLLLAAMLATGCSDKKKSCSTNTDCPEWAYCRESDGTCVGCTEGEDHPSENACVADSVDACGLQGEPCEVAKAHQTVACTVGECVYECLAGWEACDAGCCATREICDGDAGCVGEGKVCNDNWGICAVADCTGQPDFTPCEVSSPKYSYNICADGACIEPGSCGDASCNTPGPSFTLADTGQTKCYDETNNVDGIPCPAEGEGLFGQDAWYGWDRTHGSSETRFTPVTLNGDRVVTDNVTKLEWQGCVKGVAGGCPELNPTVCTGTGGLCTWPEALVYCDRLNWGKNDDWRLPDPYELLSIVDAGRMAPSIDVEAFSEMKDLVAGSFWSSSGTGNSDRAWAVDFNDGYVMHNDKSNTYYVVRCVRGANVVSAQQAERHTKTITNHQPVVTDNVTRLVWQGCVAGRTGDSCENTVKVDVCTGGTDTTDERCMWREALAYCETLDWNGKGWRLPNMKELQSIVDYRVSPSISSAFFPAMPNDDCFHSSSSYAGYPPFPWYVCFGMGNVENGDSYKSWPAYVRCVRDRP